MASLAIINAARICMDSGNFCKYFFIVSYLRFLARQYNQRMLTLKTNKVFLLNLLDETMPGITNILPLTTRTPETSLSVLFINRFKSYDRIKKMGKSRFLDAFEKIARKSRNRQTKTYGLAIYEAALRNITTRGENEYTLAAQDQCLELVCESQKAAIQLSKYLRSIRM